MSNVKWKVCESFKHNGHMWALFKGNTYVGNVFKNGNKWEASLPGNVLISMHKTSQEAAKSLIKTVIK